MSASPYQEYDPYILDTTEVRKNPPMIISSEFLRDINKPQLLKVFKTVTSGFLELADNSTEDLTETTRNLADTNYKNLMDVVSGRLGAGGIRAMPFDNNPIQWRDTIISDDIIACRYYNPALTASTTDSMATDELLYFLYDIVEPTSAYEEYWKPELGSIVDTKPFTAPVYRIIQSNKIAAITKVHDVECQLYGYTHNWFYFNLKGYDMKCDFLPPLDTEIISGVPGNEHYPAIHSHSSDCVLVPGTTEAENPALSPVTNTRPVNARDFFSRAAQLIKSKSECLTQQDMSSRYAPGTGSISILPSGAVIGPDGLPAMNNDGSQYAKTWGYLKLDMNRRVIDEDKIVDKGV